MEPALMIESAVALLALAATVGMVLAGIRLTGAPYPPAALAMAHGLLAGSALTLLVYAALTVGVAALVKVALVILAVAAAIGTWLNLGFHARQRPIPMRTMWIHIAVALTGFTLLLLVLIRGS